MNNFHEQARAAYKRGDFTEAIALFDRAISRTESIQILDNRAACYTKLGQLPDALKDAKATIQLQREDPTGYLRAGKILIEMEKPKVALEIYTHGLKSIKHVGQGYELLKVAHQDLMDKLSPPRSKDPLTVLPPEIAEMMLQYLNFRQRTNACRVSKQWASYIRSNPNLWRHLDLSNARRKVKNAFVSRAINCSRHKLRQATLTTMFEIPMALAALVRHCPLEELEIMETGGTVDGLVKLLKQSKTLSVLKLGASNKLSASDLRQLCDTVVLQLQHMQISTRHVPSFQSTCSRMHTLSLEIRAMASTDLRALFASIATHMPALENFKFIFSGQTEDYAQLNLKPCSKLRKLELDLSKVSVKDLLLPESVTSLSFAGDFMHYFRYSSRGPGDGNTSYQPNLTEFSMPITNKGEWEVYDMTLNTTEATMEEHGYESSTSFGSRLHTLNLRVDISTFPNNDTWLLDLDTYEDIFLCERLKDLETLSLAGSIHFRDEEMRQVIDKLPKLWSLDVSGTDITGVGVKYAVEWGHVEHLCIRNCRNVGQDAVDWARTQGVEVDFSRKMDDVGGSKVRY